MVSTNKSQGKGKAMKIFTNQNTEEHFACVLNGQQWGECDGNIEYAVANSYLPIGIVNEEGEQVLKDDECLFCERHAEINENEAFFTYDDDEWEAFYN